MQSFIMRGRRDKRQTDLMVLKEWCHWKRTKALEFENPDEELELVRVIESVISQVGTYAAQAERLQDQLWKFSVYGTDDCKNCDEGRITLYMKHGWCPECLHKAKDAPTPVGKEEG